MHTSRRSRCPRQPLPIEHKQPPATRIARYGITERGRRILEQLEAADPRRLQPPEGTTTA
ncbi:MAG TPA: hypothetical protein VHB30_06715 [Solirubrobacteraceae bacterium]|nr:hypothetical protein [Solirubrobacteraceae bacterium]